MREQIRRQFAHPAILEEAHHRDGYAKISLDRMLQFDSHQRVEAERTGGPRQVDLRGGDPQRARELALEIRGQ